MMKPTAAPTTTINDEERERRKAAAVSRAKLSRRYPFFLCIGLAYSTSLVSFVWSQQLLTHMHAQMEDEYDILHFLQERKPSMVFHFQTPYTNGHVMEETLNGWFNTNSVSDYNCGVEPSGYVQWHEFVESVELGLGAFSAAAGKQTDDGTAAEAVATDKKAADDDISKVGSCQALSAELTIEGLDETKRVLENMLFPQHSSSSAAALERKNYDWWYTIALYRNPMMRYMETIREEAKTYSQTCPQATTKLQPINKNESSSSSTATMLANNAAAANLLKFVLEVQESSSPMAKTYEHSYPACKQLDQRFREQTSYYLRETSWFVHLTFSAVEEDHYFVPPSSSLNQDEEDDDETETEETTTSFASLLQQSSTEPWLRVLRSIDFLGVAEYMDASLCLLALELSKKQHYGGLTPEKAMDICVSSSSSSNSSSTAAVANRRYKLLSEATTTNVSSSVLPQPPSVLESQHILKVLHHKVPTDVQVYPVVLREFRDKLEIAVKASPRLGQRFYLDLTLLEQDLNVWEEVAEWLRTYNNNIDNENNNENNSNNNMQHLHHHALLSKIDSTNSVFRDVVAPRVSWKSSGKTALS